MNSSPKLFIISNPFVIPSMNKIEQKYNLNEKEQSRPKFRSCLCIHNSKLKQHAITRKIVTSRQVVMMLSSSVQWKRFQSINFTSHIRRLILILQCDIIETALPSQYNLFLLLSFFQYIGPVQKKLSKLRNKEIMLVGSNKFFKNSGILGSLFRPPCSILIPTNNVSPKAKKSFVIPIV